MRKITYILSTLIITFGVVFETIASTSSIRFRTLSVDEGLSQSTVLAIAQDAAGAIWMGTQDGLNRYDGYEFSLFRNNPANPHYLRDNTINALFADGGLMWIGTASGLSCYNAERGEFDNFSLAGRAMQIYDIAATRDGGGLVLATDLGIVLFDKTLQTLEIKTYLTGISVHSICPSRDGFLAGTSNGIYNYSTTYGTVTRVLPQMERYDIASIVAEDDGYWVATHGNGLYRIDSSMQITGRYTAAANQGLVSDYIRVLKRDGEGRLWIGTFDGLSIRDPRTGLFSRYVHTAVPWALSHNSIRSIFIDAQQGVWLGTYYGGANYYHPLAERFGIMRSIPSRNSLGDNTVSAIVGDDDGNLWIGTNDDGVNIYDRRADRFTSYNAENGALLSNNIKCILPDGRGGMWVGTHAGGLSRMEGSTRRARHYPISAAIPINNSCYSLLDGGDGTLWVGTLSGLLSLDVATGRFSRHLCSEYQPRLSSAHINALVRDSRRRVWIATATGLHLYLPETREVRSFDHLAVSHPTSEPRQEIAVMSVFEDSHRTVWVGTRRGLFRYNEHDNTFTNFSVAEGLPNEVVYGILEDELSRLWISTNGGLSCFDTRVGTFRNYTIADGIANNQFNPYAYYRDPKGVFYFGGIGGVTYFRPHDLVDNPFTPVAQVTEVEIADAGDDSRIKIDRDSTGGIARAAFPSVHNIFTVRFVALNPLSAGRNTFSYKLDGFNTRWYETTNREVTYSNLSPGRYKFLVRAANNDGRWSDQISEVEIRVMPMWWQTLVAKIFWVLLSIAAVAWVIFAVLGRMKMAMQLKLERMEKESIGELSQEKIRFYVNLSHELRTPLTLIMSPLQEIRERGTNDTYVASRLNYIYRNSLKLLHIINQLLDYRKAEVGAFRMRVAMQDVDAIVGEAFSMFEDTAQNRDMDYILISDLKGDQLPVDRMFIEMMLTNLLSNAFKFTADGGSIRVELRRGAGVFSILVRDSGVGMSVEQRKHIFERFYNADEMGAGGGLGMSIVRRIVEMHQGEISVQSEVGKFSEFVISLPDTITAYPEQKRAKDDDVRGSIIRDAGKYLPEEWAGDESLGFKVDQESHDEKRGTLLVAEGNGEVSRYIAEYLNQYYNIVSVADGHEALESLKTLEPDLIIADRVLPGLDGLKVCQTVKQNIRTCHIPVILLAPEGGVEEQITGIEAGADAYLPMPLSISLLAAKVSNLMKTRYRMQHYYSDDGEIDPDKITSNSMDGEFLKKAIGIVEQNLDNELFSSNDFSKALYMSRSSLHLKMKSITGESVMKFIRKIRFNVACRLLLERKHSISEISVMVGFNSPSYFATSFKKHYGCLPTEYYLHVKKGK